MKTKIHQPSYSFITIVVTFALGVFIALKTMANDFGIIAVEYTIPAAFGRIESLASPEAVSDADVTVIPTCDGNDPACVPEVQTRSITLSKGSASVHSTANLNQFAASALSGGPYPAYARAYAPFIVQDPQHRTQVKVNLHFKALASSSPLLSEGENSAVWEIAVFPASGPWDLQINLDNPSDPVYTVVHPFPDGYVSTYKATGGTSSAQNPENGSWFYKYIWKFGGLAEWVQDQGSSVGIDVDPDNISVIPGLPYVMAIIVEARGGGFAVIDPVVTPNVDNPDITIEFPNTATDPNPQPLLADLTPEELQTIGIDPQPFIDLGFFDSPTPSNQPPVARCQNVAVPATMNSCAVASASINNGSSDPDGDTLSLTQSPLGPYSVGNTEVILTASDGVLSSQCTAIVTVIDGQAPVITCPTDQSTPATNSNGAAVTFAPISADNCGTVMTSCSPASGTTFPLGATPVTCTATDGAGIQNGCSFNVTVNDRTSYSFTGFFQPVDNTPTFNAVKAGQGVPVKFSLGGNYGLDILANGSPISQQIPCPNGEAGNDIEQIITASSSSLQYDAATSTYTYVWKTQKTWAGQCRQFTLTLADGTSHSANFQFK